MFLIFKYHYILLNYALPLLHRYTEHHLLLLMRRVNGAQFLNITFLLTLFAAIPPAAMFVTVKVPLTSIHTSL